MRKPEKESAERATTLMECWRTTLTAEKSHRRACARHKNERGQEPSGRKGHKKEGGGKEGEKRKGKKGREATRGAEGEGGSSGRGNKINLAESSART